MAPHKARGSSVCTSRLGVFFASFIVRNFKFLRNRQLTVKTWKEVLEHHAMTNDLLEMETLNGHNETKHKQN